MRNQQNGRSVYSLLCASPEGLSPVCTLVTRATHVISIAWIIQRSSTK